MNLMSTPVLEICAASLASALASEEGGAFRVELCDNLYEGGTTPSPGTIALAREKLNIKLHVLIRPRGGDFLYSDEELDIMCRDIEFCKERQVDGVVIGILDHDGRVDVEKTAGMVELAWPMAVTFHRAFDMTPDPFEALEDVIKTGAGRILTSGQKNLAPEAAGLIADLVEKAGKRIIIMPGAGLDEHNIGEFAGAVKAQEYHATLRNWLESLMIYRKQEVFMGGMREIPEFAIKITDADRVRRFVNILKSLNPA